MTFSKKTKGITAATSVAFFQGFEGLLFPLFGFVFSFALFQSSGFSSASLLLKEIVSFLITFAIVGPKKIISLLKIGHKSKEARLFFYAGLFGTSLGNLFFIIAIQMAGSGYGVVLTSLYPIFSMLIIKFFQREKESIKVWTGVILALAGSILLTLLPALIYGNGIDSLKMIGIILGALAAFFWAIEGFLINLGINKKENSNISSSDIVGIRSISTVAMSAIFIMPFSYFLSKTIGSTSVFHFNNPYEVFVSLLSHWESVLIIFAISLNLVILRKMHVYAIAQIGTKLTAIIDTNNFLIPSFFSIFLAFGGWTFVNGDEFLFSTIEWWSWFLLLPIFLGVFIVLYFHDPKPNEEPDKIMT